MARSAIAAILLSLSVLSLGGCGGPPQIGADRESFKAVDALYTAVSLKDAKLVDRCGEKLKGLHDAGKLPDDAWKALERFTAGARDGDWENAQNDLSSFMEGQRR
jgi:hypothetical protein